LLYQNLLNEESFLNRNIYAVVFPVGLCILLLGGCAETPVKVGDNHVEQNLQEVTGLTTDDVEKATQKSSMNLWDVFALAVKHTETMATSAENVEQAKAQNNQAIGAWLPQIGLNGTKAFISNDFLGGGFNGLSPISADTVYLSGSETIFSGLTQVAAIQGAGANIDFQNYNFQNQSRLLLLNVANAFYNVLALEEAETAYEKSKDLNEQTLVIEKQWQKMGRAQTEDVANTEALLAQVLGDMENNKYQLAQARETLSTLANIPSDQPLVSEETYAVPTYTAQEAEAKVDERPDVKAARSNVAINEAELLQAHGGHLPTLSVDGEYYMAKDGGFPQPEWNIQLTASLPLFEGGQVFALEDQAASKKRQAEMNLSLTHRTAFDDVREAYKSLMASISETDAYQKAVDAYQADYQAVLHDYKLSLTTNLQLLQTMTSLETTQISYLKAKYQALYDQIWLKVATGELPKMSVYGDDKKTQSN
jgi:outer membrane protein